MIKLIDTPPPKLKRSVNYFGNVRAECQLLKIGYNESSFVKFKECQYNS